MLLVLGMATAAQATLQISVNGDPDPVDTQINIGVDEYLTLDIWSDVEITADTSGYWALLTARGAGAIAGGEVMITNPDWDNGIYGNLVDNAVPVDTEVFGGICGGIFTWGAVVPAN
jgi:hypothetical protein